MPRTKFPLQFVGPDEDRPRIVRGYGKAFGGEFALVMRPSEGRSALVLVKKDGGSFWKSEPSPSDSGSDAPKHPSIPCTPAEAIALAKTEQKAVPKQGPITLRGRWTGVMLCDGEEPRVELYRKLAAYGTLSIVSHGTSGWSWSFDRAAKWFGKEAKAGEADIARLGDAIERGILGAMQLVKEACSFRDTTRRAEVDPAWAEQHPPKRSPERADPVDRLREPRPRKPRARPSRPAQPATPPLTTPAAETRPFEERYADAVATVGPGSWRALTELYGSPKDTKTQADLSAWLDKYAKDAQDAQTLLDGRDNAGEAGIRDWQLDEIARRLHFAPVARPAPGATPTKPKRERKPRGTREPSSTPPANDQASKDAQILALFKAALSEEAP